MVYGSERGNVVSGAGVRLRIRAARVLLHTLARATDKLELFLEDEGEDGYRASARARMIYGPEYMAGRPHSIPGQRWYAIPECVSRRCSGGQQATDKEMIAALFHLRDLLRGEAASIGQREFDIGYQSARIARAHLAREDLTLPRLCEAPGAPEAATTFRRSWPWHLPYAEEVGNGLLEDHFDEKHVYGWFEPTVPDSEIPF